MCLVVCQNLLHLPRHQRFFVLLPCDLAGLVRVQKQVDHVLVPGLTGGLPEEDEFAQQRGTAQGVYAIELPIGPPAVMPQDGIPFGWNPVSLDHFSSPLGVDAIPSVSRCGDRMQPMQLSRDPQTRFVGMRHRRFNQGLGNLADRGQKQFARLIHPGQQGGRGTLKMKQVGDQLRSAAVR